MKQIKVGMVVVVRGQWCVVEGIGTEHGSEYVSVRNVHYHNEPSFAEAVHIDNIKL